METILCGMNEVDSIKLEKEIEILAEINACGMTGFQEKFKVLFAIQFVRCGTVANLLPPWLVPSLLYLMLIQIILF